MRLTGKSLASSKSLASVFATAALAATMAAPALAHPPGGFTCGGTMEAPEPVPGGVYGSVSMPAGSICYLTSPVTITSPLKLGEGSGLALLLKASLTVQGPVTIGSGAAFGDLGNPARIDIDGPVTVGGDGALLIGTESLGLPSPGPIVSAIAGPVSAYDASAVQIYNTLVGGPVRISGGGGQNAIINRFAGLGKTFSGLGNNYTALEADGILGPVSETGYDGIWAGVIRDVIGGPLTFSDNAEPPQPPEGSLYIDSYDIGSNRIFGPATCDGNEPAPNMGGENSGSPSIVYGPVRGDQAATCTGTSMGTTGPPV